MDPEIENYILENSTPETELLSELYRETHLYAMHPRMASGHIQGRLLSFISKLVQPHRILEIGTFTGYSALCLAEGLTKNGKLTSIEVDDELENRIRKFFDLSEYRSSLNLIIGDAKLILKELQPGFDLVFIDGDKREYPDYFRLVKPLLNPGAVVIADNVLWDGKVIREIKGKDRMTRGVVEFNRMIQETKPLKTLFSLSEMAYPLQNSKHSFFVAIKILRIMIFLEIISIFRQRFTIIYRHINTCEVNWCDVC